jgi:branched-chain amino acid transport system permease protein
MDWLTTNFVTILDGVAFGLLLFTIAIGRSLVLGVLDMLNQYVLLLGLVVVFATMVVGLLLRPANRLKAVAA